MKVGTHNGVFHADDVFGYCILKAAFDDDIEIVRTRDPKVLQNCDLVFDVGGNCDLVFDVGGGKYDHHQVNKKYRENGVPYASAGLLWEEYGRGIVEKMGIKEAEEVERVFKNIDEKLIQGIDALDNGYDVGQTKVPIFNISSVISYMNPTWDSSIDENKAFENATVVADLVFQNALETELSVYKAKSTVIDAYNNRENPHILKLDKACPWKETLLEIDKDQEVLFTVYPIKEGDYRVQTVPKTLTAFESRADLPDAWAGKKGAELAQVTGLDDAVFCHPGKFIAGFKSLESAQAAAEMAVEHHKENIANKDTNKDFEMEA